MKKQKTCFKKKKICFKKVLSTHEKIVSSLASNIAWTSDIISAAEHEEEQRAINRFTNELRTKLVPLSTKEVIWKFVAITIRRSPPTHSLGDITVSDGSDNYTSSTEGRALSKLINPVDTYFTCSALQIPFICFPLPKRFQ